MTTRCSGPAALTAGLDIVRPWKYREESTVSNEQVAPETKGVTVKLLATVDLGPEIEGMAGRQLRMRIVTIEPGGVFGPLHDHKDRPGTVYIRHPARYSKATAASISTPSGKARSSMSNCG